MIIVYPVVQGTTIDNLCMVRSCEYQADTIAVAVSVALARPCWEEWVPRCEEWRRSLGATIVFKVMAELQFESGPVGDYYCRLRSMRN